MNKKEKRQKFVQEFNDYWDEWTKDLEGEKVDMLRYVIASWIERALFRYQMAIFGSQVKLSKEDRVERAKKAGQASVKSQKEQGYYNFQKNEINKNR